MKREGRGGSGLSAADEVLHHFSGNAPLLTFFLIIKPSCRSDPVVGPSPALRLIPVERLDIAVLFQPGEGGIEGGLLYDVFFVGQAADLLRDLIAVGGPVQKQEQDE